MRKNTFSPSLISTLLRPHENLELARPAFQLEKKTCPFLRFGRCTEHVLPQIPNAILGNRAEGVLRFHLPDKRGCGQLPNATRNITGWPAREKIPCLYQQAHDSQILLRHSSCLNWVINAEKKRRIYMLHNVNTCGLLLQAALSAYRTLQVILFHCKAAVPYSAHSKRLVYC